METESIFYLAIGLAGAFVVLVGYRLFQAAITVIGAVGGAIYGFKIVDLAFASEAVWLPVVGGLVGLLFGLGAALLVYYLGIFAAGAYVGFWFGGSFADGFDLPYPWLIILGISALTGLLAMVLERWTMIVLTSVAGAWHVTAAFAHYTRGVDLLPYGHPFTHGVWYENIEPLTVVVAVGLFLLGFFIQKSLTAKRGSG